jgi:hypothetical protein
MPHGAELQPKLQPGTVVASGSACSLLYSAALTVSGLLAGQAADGQQARPVTSKGGRGLVAVRKRRPGLR